MSKAALAEKVEEIRKKIGAAAADAVNLMRHEVDQLHKDHRALALSMQGFEKDVAAAKAAPAELRGRVFDLDDRLEALTLRHDSLRDLATRLRLVERIDALEAEQARRVVLPQSGLHRALSAVHGVALAEWAALSAGWWAWLPWRRRRAADLQAQLWVIGLVARAHGLPLEGGGPDAQLWPLAEEVPRG